MSIGNAFGTSATRTSPTDGGRRAATGDEKVVSDFITVQSLTNFTAMTGAIVTAWAGAISASDRFDTRWVPFALCVVFGFVSFLSSKPGRGLDKWAPALLISLLNSLTLFAAVLSTAEAASKATSIG